MTSAYLCLTCGTQFPPAAARPDGCPLCLDDRQYVPPGGQQWTTLEAQQGRHHNRFLDVEPGVVAIATEPALGIGQQAYLIRTPAGNVLWDLIAYVDEATIARIERLGAAIAIAISHPHYYTTAVEWSRRLGGVPVHLHESDRAWVVRPDDEALSFWSGDTLPIAPGATAIRTGGHFPGGTVLHWDNSSDDAEMREADGAGVLFCGDILAVVADRRWLTFMYSYPNQIPLDAVSVQRIADMLEGYRFDRIHDAFDRHVDAGGNAAVRRSADRYIAHIEGRAGPTI